MMGALKFIKYAAVLLFIIVVVVGARSFQGHVDTRFCAVSKLVAERQVNTIENLVASSREFRDYETEPHIRAFFEKSARQREASLVIAKNDLAQYDC